AGLAGLVVRQVRVVREGDVVVRPQQLEPCKAAVTGEQVHRAGARVLGGRERDALARGLLEDLDDPGPGYTDSGACSEAPLDESTAGQLVLLVALGSLRLGHGRSPHSQV